MSEPIKIQIVCPAERVAIGYLYVDPGDTLTADAIREFMDGAPGRVGDAKIVRDAAKEGAYLQCPRCESVLVLGLDGQEMDSICSDKLAALVGRVHYPKPGTGR